MYPRLKGKGAALSRLGGGIGTRGPGETKLETDRRHIRTRIHALEGKLAETEKRRAMQVQRRKKERVKTIALVGYTNTGKSTLLNALTGAEVLVKNALFATLDPTARSFQIEGVSFLLVDTVGFLQSLPHRLIEAFRSTLESALNADLALIVCDAAGEYETQLSVTLETLKEMGFSAPYLVVMNKCDLVWDKMALPADAVQISAKNAKGFDGLKARIMEELREEFVRAELFVPYTALSRYNAIRSLITESDVQYTDDGSLIKAIVPTVYVDRFREFMMKA